MEDRREAALARDVRRARDAVGEGAPAMAVQAQRGVLAAAPRVGDPLRPAGVAQHRLGGLRAGGGEEVERVLQARDIVVPVLGLAEADGDEAAGDAEAALRQPPAQLVALAEVAGGAEV